MLMYLLDVTIDKTTTRFQLHLFGETAFSDDGYWSVTPAGAHVLGYHSGYWEQEDLPDATKRISLFDQDDPGFLDFVTGGDTSNTNLATLISAGKAGVYLDQRAGGKGVTSHDLGFQYLTWKVTNRFF